MTPDSYPMGNPAGQAATERPADPRPGWERIAYTWLQQEVDGGQPVDPTELAREVSVAPAFAADLLQVLRAQQQRDPALTQLRARLVRDRLTELYVTRELRGGQPLDPATVASELGTTTTVARQWLHALRTVREQDPQLASLRAAAAVTELHTESRSARPTARVWAITRRTQRAHTLAQQRQTRSQRRHADRAQRDHPGHQRRTPPEREVGADAR
jgi:hypothetical protein